MNKKFCFGSSLQINFRVLQNSATNGGSICDGSGRVSVAVAAAMPVATMMTGGGGGGVTNSNDIFPSNSSCIHHVNYGDGGGGDVNSGSGGANGDSG